MERCWDYDYYIYIIISLIVLTRYAEPKNVESMGSCIQKMTKNMASHLDGHIYVGGSIIRLKRQIDIERKTRACSDILYIVTTESFYANLITTSTSTSCDMNEDNCVITIMDPALAQHPKNYQYINCSYSLSYGVQINHYSVPLHPNITHDQTECCLKVRDAYRQSLGATCVCYIYGAPGSGKSTCATFLASMLDAKLTDGDFLRSEGDLDYFYQSMEPQKYHPIIFRYDEIDSVLTQINENETRTKSLNETKLKEDETYKPIRVPFPNKKNWNDLFDKIGNGIYPYTIFLLTSNTDPDTIDKNPSFLRKGRVNMRYKFRGEPTVPPYTPLPHSEGIRTEDSWKSSQDDGETVIISTPLCTQRERGEP